MAEIAPFRGIRYDTERASANAVLAPPYDVIDEDERQRLLDRDPHNCVRLILPEGEGQAKYQRAAETLRAWQDERVLVRDEAPAIYRYHQTFTHAELGDLPVTRKGFIAAVRLHRFDEGVILPHERTLKGPKIDRLDLMRATRAHLSQIFSLYSDPSGDTDAAFDEVEAWPAHLEGTTDDGTTHRMWRVGDAGVIERVATILRDKQLYIADGHHRYETMVALRDELRGGKDLPARSSAEFGTLFCANMDDLGLIVLPTHRLVHSLPSFSREDIERGAAAWFDVEVVPGAAHDAAAVRDLLAARGADRPALAMLVPGSADLTVLSLKASFDPKAAGLTGADAVTRLDVTLLHSLILEQLLGIDRAKLEAKTNIDYIKDTQKALDATAAGKGQACFLMNATPVHQVKACSDAGEFMPQKSTFFYPKIASGVVIRPIDPAEEL